MACYGFKIEDHPANRLYNGIDRQKALNCSKLLNTNNNDREFRRTEKHAMGLYASCFNYAASEVWLRDFGKLNYHLIDPVDIKRPRYHAHETVSLHLMEISVVPHTSKK
jgi:hypothetical protein